MSVSSIPSKTKYLLWGKAAGRCQYDGCNELVCIDSITKSEFNIAYIAHIIADRPDGPRGHKVLSEKLAKDLSNLMLLCDTHHRLIDIENVAGHPVEMLKSMKENHEERIELVTSIVEEKQSHMLLYGANIGEQFPRPNWNEAAEAMIPDKYPAEKPGIELSLLNCSYKDYEIKYWEFHCENLERQFKDKVTSKLAFGEISHLSVFAFATIPLLIKLGTLLNDIPNADVYQRHREPTTWKWKDGENKDFSYIIEKPSKKAKSIALNISLTGTITDDRITKVMGDDVSIWKLTIDRVERDFLQNKNQLRIFRETFRSLLNEIKTVHGQENTLNIFPVIPLAVAIEIGRVWMPKADLSLKVFDQNRTEGFIPTIDYGNT